MMVAIAPAVESPLNLSDMAKRSDSKKLANFRIDKALLHEARAVGDSFEYRPTLTAIVETALRDWVKRNKPKRGKGSRE